MSLNWNSPSLPLLSKRIVRLTAINCPWAFGVSEKFWNTANWIHAWKTYPNMIAFEHCTQNVGVRSIWETLQLCDVNKNQRTAWEQRFVPSPYLTLNTFFFFFLSSQFLNDIVKLQCRTWWQIAGSEHVQGSWAELGWQVWEAMARAPGALCC